MQVFVRVVEHGAFVRAADALGISPASVTAAIAELEKRLGVRLLNRTTRRQSVTEEGQAYYANCVRLLGEIAEAEESLGRGRLMPHGRLRVSLPQSFVSGLFYPALRRFFEKYPDLNVEIVFTDRAVNLVEEGVDCAIRGLEIPPDTDLVARKLSDVRWLTCASPDYLAAHGRPDSIEALDDHDCVRFISQSTGRGRDWMFLRDGEPVAVEPTGRLRLTSFSGAVDSAIAGAGIAQVPDALAFPAVERGALAPILTDVVADAPALMLVHPGTRYVTAKVRAFKEFFSDEFPREGWWQRILDVSARTGSNREI